jgi:hypothetical protein
MIEWGSGDKDAYPDSIAENEVLVFGYSIQISDKQALREAKK